MNQDDDQFLLELAHQLTQLPLKEQFLLMEGLAAGHGLSDERAKIAALAVKFL